jgi:3-hydroxyacyl-[acyl-carrier-protein] dehydratase
MTDAVINAVAVGGAIVEVVATHGDVVTATVEIDRADPVFDGHYPGFPILPGLYLVEYVHATVVAARPTGSRRATAVDRVRFISPVYPGDTVTITATLSDSDGGLLCTATVSTETGPVADVRLRYAAAGRESQ